MKRRSGSTFFTFRGPTAGLRRLLRLGALLVLALVSLLAADGAGSQASGAETPHAVRLSGRQPFVTVLCRFAGTAEPVPASHFASVLSNHYPGLGDYWRTVSYGAINLDGSTLVGWYTLAASRSAYVPDGNGGHMGPALQRLAQDCAEAAGGAVDWSRYYGINLVFSDELGVNWGGQACLALAGVRKCFGATWISPSAYDDRAIWAHEMGHAFGLPHSGTDHNEYGNIWDVMSAEGPCWPEEPYGQVAQEPIGYHKALLGWIPPGRELTIRPNRVTHVMLSQLAAPGHDGYLLAKIPIGDSSSHFYTVEARRRTGYDVHLPNDAVVIHEVDTRRLLPAQPLAPPLAAPRDAGPDEPIGAGWAPGTTFTDAAHAIAVSIDAATTNGFIVTIYTGSATIPVVAPAVADAAFRPDDADLSIVRDAQGNEYRTWTEVLPEQSHGNRSPVTSILFAHRVAGGSWSDPEQVNESGLGTAHLRSTMAVDASGNAYVAWEDNRRGRLDIYFARRSARGTWSKNSSIDGGASDVQLEPALAVNEPGTVVAAWVDYRGKHPAIYAAQRAAEGSWGASRRVSDSVAGPTTEPAVAIDADGNAYAAWVGHPECIYRGATPASVYLSALPAVGGTHRRAAWLKPIIVSKDMSSSASRPHLALDNAGRLHVSWQEGRQEHEATYSTAELLGG